MSEDDSGQVGPATNAARPVEHGHAIRESEQIPLSPLLIRGAIGGILMGLANLVPGISGGTMLLAAGVYPTFVSAIAELTTLRIRARSLLAFGTIAGCAALTILLLAGGMKTLVVEERWGMYSLFIGLTLGGIPLVWRLARPANASLWLAALTAFLLMAWMSLGEDGGASSAESSRLRLLFSGLAGASAMILPGISGGYLLLLLGQYEKILSAIDGLKRYLLDGGANSELLGPVLDTLWPVGLGVVIGIVGVANLLRWLLDRFEKPTLGFLLGLLLGSVVGLYPFQAPTPPEAGFVHRGAVLTAEEAAQLDAKYWALQRFSPTSSQLGLSFILILGGLGTTQIISRIGRDDSEASARRDA